MATTKNEWWVKQNDELGFITEQLLDEYGNPYPLTDATSVTFSMRRPTDATAKVSAAATIITPSAGIVRYAWATDDTDVAGDFQQEWEVMFTGPLGPLTFPNDGYNIVHVLKELA